VSGPWRHLAIVAALAGLSACGTPEQRQEQARINAERAESDSINSALGDPVGTPTQQVQERETLFDLLDDDSDPSRQIAVNRYLWAASLDTLAFLPIEAADPFSGLITTDWGRIAGDPTPVRVTVLINDPALDARSLRVAGFRQQGGRAVPLNAAENRQLEDAILTRARQMRIEANRR
jgi:hypothetical protein